MKNKKVTKELAEFIQNITPEKRRATENRLYISIKICETIKKKGLTVSFLSNKMHKDLSEVEHWLDGTYNFSINELSEIEIALDVKLLNTEL